MPSPTAQDSKLHFGQLAIQYYVAGRSAAIDQILPVCGNLLHHAVEMSLKAALTDGLTMPELKKLGHSLPKIWAAFTTSFPEANVPAFNQAVVELDRFEELRYPDSILAKGAMIEFVLFFRAHHSESVWEALGSRISARARGHRCLAGVNSREG